MTVSYISIVNTAVKCQGHPVSLWRWPLTCDLEKMLLIDVLLFVGHVKRRKTITTFACIDETLPTCSRSEPLIYMNIEGNYQVTLWRQRWRHHHKITFWGIIWDDLLTADVKLKLCLRFPNFQNGRLFDVATIFLPEAIPEVEHASKIAINVSNILSFWSML